MSKTVDDLIGVYIEASNAVVWEAEKRGLCPMTLDMQRAGIAAVVSELMEHFVTGASTYAWDADDLHAEFMKILGDAGAATAGAIQPQGETKNGLRRSIEGPEGGAASGAFGLERQGDVVGASGAGPEQQDDVAVHLHRVPRGACGVPEGEPGSVAGVTDGPVGRGLGDSSLIEKVAGACADGTVVQRQRYGENDRQSKDGAEVSPRHPDPATDFGAHLARQRAFSERTFGPGERVEGVSDHIRKELLEVAKAEGGDERQAEWIDVVMLALDGAWRSGMTPEQIMQGLRDKLEKNERRTWPDWRTADPNKAIEHDRATDPAPAVCEWTQEGWEYRTAGCNGWSAHIYSPKYSPPGNKCPHCKAPIKFTEAK